jgi:hypothetical protein
MAENETAIKQAPQVWVAVAEVIDPYRRVDENQRARSPRVCERAVLRECALGVAEQICDDVGGRLTPRLCDPFQALGIACIGSPVGAPRHELRC